LDWRRENREGKADVLMTRARGRQADESVIYEWGGEEGVWLEGWNRGTHRTLGRIFWSEYWDEGLVYRVVVMPSAWISLKL
jgi:hypothetical protein